MTHSIPQSPTQIDHDKLCARIAQAEAALKGAPQQ